MPSALSTLLLLAVPLAAALSAGARRGLLVKGGAVIEQLARVRSAADRAVASCTSAEASAARAALTGSKPGKNAP